MGVSEKEHDLKRHSHTIPNTTTTVYRPTSLQFSIHELQSTVEDTEYRYRPSSPSVGSLTEDGVTDEYTFDYKNGRHGKTRNGHWKPNVREWLVLICVSAVVMMDAYNATVIVPMVPVCDLLSFIQFYSGRKSNAENRGSTYPTPLGDHSKISYGWSRDIFLPTPSRRPFSPCLPKYSLMDPF